MIAIGDVVLAFLKAEIDYSDSREQIQKNIKALGLTREELIDRADLENEHLNYVRAALLEYRGYLSRGPIGGLSILDSREKLIGGASSWNSVSGTKRSQRFNSSTMRPRRSSETCRSSWAKNAAIPISCNTLLACAPYLRSSCEYDMKARALGLDNDLSIA